MTSHSDNCYDVTNPFCCHEMFLAYTLFEPSFIVVRGQMAELELGGGGGRQKTPDHTPAIAHQKQDERMRNFAGIILTIPRVYL